MKHSFFDILSLVGILIELLAAYYVLKGDLLFGGLLLSTGLLLCDYADKINKKHR
ncbi:hypothetical protein [Streptococcus acidominimus]|uniref:hypothetical protein n=1 Tax=Streptococcus acidominimus TaxID=1326 RepID=UPI000ACCEA83|nr:hypothetical protein [Streptococcus acidominimus]